MMPYVYDRVLDVFGAQQTIRTLYKYEPVAIGCAIQAMINKDPSFFNYELKNSQVIPIEGRMFPDEINQFIQAEKEMSDND